MNDAPLLRRVELGRQRCGLPFARSGWPAAQRGTFATPRSSAEAEAATKFIEVLEHEDRRLGIGAEEEAHARAEHDPFFPTTSASGASFKGLMNR